jgi:hypothetical protein
MRVLTSSVLVMEAIVLGLAIPVVLVAGGQPAWFAWLLAGLAIVAVLLPAAVKRPWFVAAGWVLQGGVLVAGAYDLATSQGAGVMPMLLILGVIFTGLWWAALHYGAKAEQIRAQATPPAA